jgi:putative transcriptional regulator
MELDFNIFKIEYNKVVPQRGRVLVAEPFLQDTYFKRALVLLTEYNSEGSVGFVLNKSLDVNISEVIEDFPDFEATVAIGGPVSTNTIHYLHTLGNIIPNSEHVFGNVYWGGDFDVIKEMIETGQINRNQIRFFLGYSGWQAGQLENELNQNSWLVTEVNSSGIMVYNSNIWKETMNTLGEKYKIWSNFPENPGFN